MNKYKRYTGRPLVGISTNGVYYGKHKNTLFEFLDDEGDSATLRLELFEDIPIKQSLELIGKQIVKYATIIEEEKQKLDNFKADYSALLDLQKEEEMKKITSGSRWKNVDSESEYIIATVTMDTYSLINLKTGCRWANAVSDIVDVFAGAKQQFKFID